MIPVSASMLGKSKRIKRLLKDEKTVVVPLDDFLISGAQNRETSLSNRIKKVVDGEPDAILGYAGLAANFSANFKNIPFILNLTASTMLSHVNHKVLCTNFEQALYMDAEAVAVHINVSNDDEAEMIHVLENIAFQCQQYGMPLLVIIYPRRGGNDPDYLQLKRKEPEKYADLVVHAVHIAVELGADIVKTQYTGRVDTFERVIDAACGVPVIAAGGNLRNESEVFKMASDVMKANASGVCFGRNVFLNEHPEKVIQMLKKIVHEGIEPEKMSKGEKNYG